MGTWSTGIFDNDGALDFVALLVDDDDAREVRGMLTGRASEDGEAVLVAIAAVVLARGHDVEGAPDELITFADAHRGALAKLDAAAKASLAAVRERSGLRERWAEGDDFAAWEATLEPLRAALEAPTRKRTRRRAPAWQQWFATDPRATAWVRSLCERYPELAARADVDELMTFSARLGEVALTIDGSADALLSVHGHQERFSVASEAPEGPLGPWLEVIGGALAGTVGLAWREIEGRRLDARLVPRVELAAAHAELALRPSGSWLGRLLGRRPEAHLRAWFNQGHPDH